MSEWKTDRITKNDIARKKLHPVILYSIDEFFGSSVFDLIASQIEFFDRLFKKKDDMKKSA
jgi:hypothetical protein